MESAPVPGRALYLVDGLLEMVVPEELGLNSIVDVGLNRTSGRDRLSSESSKRSLAVQLLETGEA